MLSDRQIASPPNDSATAVFVPWMNFGEPESPKQMPPLPSRESEFMFSFR